MRARPKLLTRFESGFVARAKRAQTFPVKPCGFCTPVARHRAAMKKRRKEGWREGGEEETRRSVRRPVNSQTRRIRARTRFLHCCLVWIAGVRAPLIITICCRVRVSCYAALTRICLFPLLPPPPRPLYRLFFTVSPLRSAFLAPSYCNRPFVCTHSNS